MLKNFSVHSVFPLFESGSRVAQAGPGLTLRMTFSPYSENDLNSYSEDDLSSYSEDDPELTPPLDFPQVSFPFNQQTETLFPSSFSHYYRFPGDSSYATWEKPCNFFLCIITSAPGPKIAATVPSQEYFFFLSSLVWTIPVASRTSSASPSLAHCAHEGTGIFQSVHQPTPETLK